MVQRRIPLLVYQPAKAGIHSFGILAACEAAARSILISVFPVLMYRSLGDAKTVSEFYLYIGFASLTIALFVPWLARFIPRRWLYTSGALMMIGGNLAGFFGGITWVPFALLANTVALVIMTVCFNAYVMDYIERSSMSRNETVRLLYSGVAWSVGPYAGVWLMGVEPLAPFVVSIIACIGLLCVFWYLRLGNGKVITKAKAPAANPLAFLARFIKQPLLISGWLFSVVRSIGWAIYIIYLPIYAVENGLSEQLGGISLSISNAFLFLTPLMLRFVQSKTVRLAIMVGFVGSGLAFVLATFVADLPYIVVACLLAGTIFLVLLDVCAGLPFLMSVKPSERTEMAAVYSTFRDVSAVASPGFARIVLIFSPVYGVFAAGGIVLILSALLASRLHPRLGKKHHS